MRWLHGDFSTDNLLRSGLARQLCRARPTSTFASAGRRTAFQPIKKNSLPSQAIRCATTAAGNGKIHQVIGAVVDGMRNVTITLLFQFEIAPSKPSSLTRKPVKFDSEQLPPILNALETVNDGQKLVLEVAV